MLLHGIIIYSGYYYLCTFLSLQYRCWKSLRHILTCNQKSTWGLTFKILTKFDVVYSWQFYYECWLPGLVQIADYFYFYLVNFCVLLTWLILGCVSSTFLFPKTKSSSALLDGTKYFDVGVLYRILENYRSATEFSLSCKANSKHETLKKCRRLDVVEIANSDTCIFIFYFFKVKWLHSFSVEISPGSDKLIPLWSLLSRKKEILHLAGIL